MVTEVKVSQSFLDDGHHSVKSWVAAVANCTPNTAMARVRAARMLADLPEVAAANAAGDVGADQLRMLANLHSNPLAREHMAAHQDAFVFWAREFAVREFAESCTRWRAAADPDGSMADQDACRENRRARFDELGAGFRFTAEGDGLTGDILRRALEERIRIEWEHDLAERAAEFGDAAEQHPLPRTQAQRAHDAWVHLMLNGPHERHQREPLVNIVCTPDVLVRAIRDFVGGPAPTVITRDAPDDEAHAVSLRSYLCETVSGVQVDPRDLVIAALTGEVRRVVKDSAGRVIDLGRRSRLFRGGSREAVLLTDCRCSRPGCCDLHVGLQIDHRSPWGALFGVTSSVNGAALCGRQIRAKHELKLRITRDETGWRWWRADGTEIAPRHPPD